MRRWWMLFLILGFAVSAMGQGMPHMLTGQIERFEGGIPEDGCVFIYAYDVGGNPVPITSQTYNETTGVWTASINSGDVVGAGDSVFVEVVDSCWGEKATFEGVVSSSFMTDLGFLTLSPIPGIRPEFADLVVSPDTGYIEDSYTITFTYIHGLDRAPAEIVVYVDGAEYLPEPVDPTDSDYTDGVEYQLTLTGDELGLRNHEYTVSVYAVDGVGRPGWSDTTTFYIANHPPVLDTAYLTVDPEPATEISTITCNIGTITDSEGDEVTVKYRWFVDGTEITDITGNTIDGTYFDKHNLVWCEVVPCDSLDCGDAVYSDTVEILNTPPTVPVVSIDPAEPFDFEDVAAVIDSEATDVDGDSVSYHYEWRLDDVTMSTLPMLDDSLTSTGQHWTLVVWAYDGEEYGGADTVEFTIGGPVLSDGYVEPTDGHASTEFAFYVTYTNSRNYPPATIYVDIDGELYPMTQQDPTDSDYTDGAVMVYTAALEVGDHQFRFSGTDEMGDVAVGMEDYITGPSVWDNAPAIDEVSITPYPEARRIDNITALVTAWHDDDGDEVSFKYEWYRNGELVDSLRGQVVPAMTFTRGDTVWCVVTPFDGYIYGDPVASPTVVIVNTPPDAPVVGVEPAEPYSFEDVVAQVVNPSEDADGDDIEYTYLWYRDGHLVDEGETLSAEYTSTGEEWTLAVVPYDGYDYGDTAWFSFTVGGPVLSDGYVAPASGHPTDEFTYYVTYTNSRNYAPAYVRVDIDGELYDMVPSDTTDTDYTDGVVYEYTTTLDYGEHQFRFFAEDDRGDPAVGMGDYMSGPTMTNELPVIDSVAISPYPTGTVVDEYEVTVVAWHDDDGDDVVFGYQWYRNGEPIEGAGLPTIDGSEFTKGDTVWCVITPYDGYDYGEPVETPHIPVVNAAPVVINPYIDVSPAGEPTELSTLTATQDSVYDPDGDMVFFSYQWVVNGDTLDVPGSYGAIDGEYFDRGDTVVAVITFSDGEDAVVVSTEPVVIGNALPVVTEFGIEPHNPYTTDDLMATLDYYDPDSDDVTVMYRWYRDGEFVSDSDRVPAEMTSHYEVWVLEARLTDGFDPEEYTVVYDTVQILNSAPELTRDFVDTFAISGVEYRAMIPAADADMDYLTFDLVEGPEGLEVHGDGSILWEDVPDVDAPTPYDVVIDISDGDDTLQLAYTLWVYPFDDPIFAPSGLEAVSGYTNLIPLSWNPPLAFSAFPYLPIRFDGYEIYRTTDTVAGDWELLTTTPMVSAVDTNVEPYTVYFYKVVAVYDIGSSQPSNVDFAFAEPGTPTDWYSTFDYNTPPVIDGVIDSAEWADAMVYTYNVGDAECKLYFMNKGGYLYVAFEDGADSHLSNYDMFVFSLDDNDDDRWFPHEGSNEGEYRIRQTDEGAEVTFQGIWGTFPGGIGRDLRVSVPGVEGAVSDEMGYVTYELAIPIGSDPAYLNIPELGTWVGARVAVYDVDKVDWDLILPDGSDPEDPAGFGELYISPGEPNGALCYHPEGLDVTLRQGFSTTRLLTIENCGMGYLNYEITEACAMPPRDEGEMFRTADDVANIVAFVDDASLVPQAIDILGYFADIYTDPAEFVDAVHSRDYDLVIVSTNNGDVPDVWSAVMYAMDRGSKVLIQTPDLDAVSGNPLWGYLGLSVGADLGDRGSAINFELPDHPFFNVPFRVPPSVERIEGDFTDYGDNLIPGDGYSVLATFDLYPYPNNAAIVYNEDKGVVVNSFLMSDLNDTDGDSLIDGVELLVDEIAGLLPCDDVPWLSEEPLTGNRLTHEQENVVVTFDASGLEPGEYHAFLMIHTNDPAHPLAFVPCHLTVTEPEPRPLELTVNNDNYGCPEEEVVVPIYVNSLDMMGVTSISMTVSVDPEVAQPVAVEAGMGEVSSFSFGPGTITFTINNEYPLPGDGILAMVHFTINRDAPVGASSAITISDVSYNEDAYVTSLNTYPGNLHIISCVNSWWVDLEFTAFGALPDKVRIGVDPDGTNAYDEGLDRINVPTGSFLDPYSDISAWDPEHPHLGVDIRNGNDVEIHWYIETGDSAGKVEWSFNPGLRLSSIGSLLLYCGDEIVDMKEASVYYYEAGQDIEIVYRATGERMFTFNFDAGYNMFSLPLNTSTTSVDELLPGNYGVWRFDPDLDTWVSVSDLEPGVGYIALFFEPTTITVWGTPVEELDLNLAPGWNLIGTVMGDVDFSNPDDDPDGSILGSPGHAWYYDSGLRNYVNVDMLEAGKGYFVAALNPCTLHLPGGASSGKVAPVKPEWKGTITVDDVKLTVGVGDKTRISPIPPVVPGGNEPVSYLEVDGWKAAGAITTDDGWDLVLNKDATVKFDLPAGVQVFVDGEPVDGSVNLKVGTYRLTATYLPSKFALESNVPNPFNASTEIRFAVPTRSVVNLAIYDLSGHLVRTLVDGEVEPGFHSVVWDGTDNAGNPVGSGVYLCRMKGGDFSAVRRMMLVK